MLNLQMIHLDSNLLNLTKIQMVPMTKVKIQILHVLRFIIPAWYINIYTIIDFTIYTRLFLVKLKSVVDGPILHSKSVVDGSILHCKAKFCAFSKI